MIGTRRRRDGALAPAAMAFLTVATASAVAATGGAVLTAPLPHLSALFVACALAAAAAQFFVVITPKNQSYHISMPFIVGAAAVLPIALLPLVAVVQHVPEWIRLRYRWYIQLFNVSNYTLSMIAGAVMARAARGATSGDFEFAVAGVSAAVTVVLVNHLLLAVMLRLARQHSFRATGLFSAAGLSTDGALAAAGVTIAYIWTAAPQLVLVAIAPLVLFHRSLVVPQLAAEARADPKTGLLNSRHFTQTLEDELARAARLERPVALVMADLDFLRDINNTYGHLAGDAVLTGVARVFRRELRDNDVPTRFGGEEFAILLPDTDAACAAEVAERVRAAIAAECYSHDSVAQPIHATVSLGVATFPDDAVVGVDLIHKADQATYAAKARGRNRVVSWREVAGADDDDTGAAEAPLLAVTAVR